MVLKAFLLLSIIFFVACKHEVEPIINQNKSVLKNTSKKYRTRGIGNDKKEAVADALTNIGSQISSTVDSTFNIYKKSTDLEYKRVVTSKTNMKVTSKDFNNFQSLKEWEENGKYFIELEVDREKLAGLYLLKIKRAVNKMENELKERSDFKKYIFLKSYIFDDIYLQFSYVRAITPQSKDIVFYENKIKAFQNQEIKYRKEMTFKVESTNAKVKNIAIDVLNQAHFDVSSNGKIVLNIDLGKMDISEVYNEYFGAVSTTVKVVNEQELISKSLKLSSKSIDGKEMLMHGILEDLEQKLLPLLEEML